VSAAGAEDDLVTPAGLRLPAAALAWRFSRSTGPGGQHVNTADTRVELTVDLTRLDGPPDAVERVRAAAGDELRIVASTERSQLQNRMAARRRLAERLDAAARPRRRRRATLPPRSAVEARLRDKRATARRKAQRSGSDSAEE
jgi:ribosome-associated protein